MYKLNTFGLLLSTTTFAHDHVQRSQQAAALELAARKQVVRNYMADNNLPEQISKSECGSVIQGFVLYYH